MTEQTNTLKLYKFTNKPDSPYLDTLLQMFYSASAQNKIGIMEGYDTETEKEVLLLVGVDIDEEGKTTCYPLARCLPAEEIRKYQAPDGEGGFLDTSETVTVN